MKGHVFFPRIYLFVVAICMWKMGNAGNAIDKEARKDEVLEMFEHAYNSYMTHAYPADELMPLSCRGRVRGREPNRGDVDDSLGNFSLTLIDTLDTLAVLGMLDEFEEAVKKVIKDVTFDTDVVVSVFETNIRVLGGLLGGHTAAKDIQEQYGRMAWYKEELLTMAKEVGYRLLPAFNTSTGVPYPKVNLRHGLGKGRNERDTCTACAGTMLLEFSALSRLSGDPIFEEKAHSVMQTLWSKRQRTSNLVGTVINIHTGDWVRRESGVGAGIDSYYEYLLKGYILLGDDSYLDRFNTHYEAVRRYISDGPLLMDVQMHRPHARSRNFMDALLAFWPGLQVLFGDIEPAIETHEMLYQVTQRHNFLPEAFTPQYDVYWAQHPLRPEFIESTYMLYKATSDPYYLEVGGKIIDSLQNHARVHCGFAGIKDVRTGSHEDRMDSFVLAETFKYLYLLFAEPEDLVLNVDNYLLTTEAHILPLSISKLKSESAPAANASEMHEDVIATLMVDRSCANHKYLFPGGSSYAQRLRDPLKKSKDAQSGQCPSTTQQNAAASDGSRLKAAEFVPGNPDHMQQLTQMGIRLITMKDGRVQLMHTASNAVTPKAAEQGAIFMQEMIELSKSQQAEVADNHPRVVQVMSPPVLKNVVLAAGPAQFGMDLNENFAAVGEVVVADPLTACEGITNGGDMLGKIIIMSRGDCMFIEKARIMEKFGAHGGIVIDNVADTSSDTASLFAMSGDGKDDVNIPMVFLFSKEGKILMDAIKEHGTLEVLLLDKAKNLGELNEIWEHYHSANKERASLRVKAQVDSVQVGTATEAPDTDQPLDVHHDDEFYDEDGDDEYECRAPGGSTTPAADATGSQEGQLKRNTKQLTDYLHEITQFAFTKSDIERFLDESQEVAVDDHEFRESTKAKLDQIMAEYRTIDGILRHRLEGSSDGAEEGFLTRATPLQLQTAFDHILQEYLETEEGKQHRADRAESALKHGMDSYDNFEVHPNSLAALGDIPKSVMENIVNEFVMLEKMMLEFDKFNPLHQLNGDEDDVLHSDVLLKANQDASRTKPSILGDDIEESAGQTNGKMDPSGSDGSHIPKYPRDGNLESDSGTSGVVDQHLRLRQALSRQREKLLEQQVKLNQKNQHLKTDRAASTSRKQKEEL